MKNILCYGDSNTWGLIPGTGDRYPENTRWTGILQDRIREKGVRIIEEGLCGRTTEKEDSYRRGLNGLVTLPGILAKHEEVDGAVIMLGTNDCKAYFAPDAEQIAHGMERCIDELMNVLPADRILVVSPIRLGEQVWLPGFDPEFDRHSVEVAAQLGVTYREMTDRRGLRLLRAADHAEPSAVDQEHMTPAGHAALAAAVYRELAAMEA